MADFALGDIYAEIDKQAGQFGISPAWAKSLLTAENTGSGSTTSRKTYSGDAVSPVGASGLFQVMPTTARGLQGAGFLPREWKHDPKNLSSQVAAGLAAMKEMNGRQRKPDDLLELAAMYNGGNRGHQAYLSGGSLVPETSNYLEKVKRASMELGEQLTPQQIERQAGVKVSPGGVAGSTGAPGRTFASNSTRTSRSLFDPAAQSAFLTESGLLSDQINVARIATGDNAQSQALIGAALADGVLTAGQDTAAAIQARSVAAAADMVTRAGILSQANLHPDQANNRVQQALDALDATSAQLDMMGPEIRQRMSVGLFDNPLEYFINQTRLPGMVNEYNGLVQVQQDQLGRYRAATNIAKDSISMSQAIHADETIAAGAAEAKATVSQALAKQKEVQLQMVAKSTADALNQVQLSQAGSQAARERMIITKESIMESEGLSEREAVKVAEQKNIDNINKVIVAGGGQPIQVMEWKGLPPKTRELLMNAGANGKFGTNFVEALQFIDGAGNIDTMAEKGMLAPRTWVNGIKQEAQRTVTEMETKAKALGDKTFNPLKTRMAVLENISETQMAQANVNMVGASKSNPYKIDYQSVVNDPAFANNIWAKRMALNGPGGPEELYQDFDEQVFMKRAIVDLMARKDPVALSTGVKQYAQDISSFYKEASKKQAERSMWPMFGYRKPEKVYPAQFKQFSAVEGKTIDLGNPTEVENMLTKQIAREVRDANNLWLQRSNRTPGGLLG